MAWVPLIVMRMPIGHALPNTPMEAYTDGWLGLVWPFQRYFCRTCHMSNRTTRKIRIPYGLDTVV